MQGAAEAAPFFWLFLFLNANNQIRSFQKKHHQTLPAEYVSTIANQSIRFMRLQPMQASMGFNNTYQLIPLKPGGDSCVREWVKIFMLNRYLNGRRIGWEEYPRGRYTYLGSEIGATDVVFPTMHPLKHSRPNRVSSPDKRWKNFNFRPYTQLAFWKINLCPMIKLIAVYRMAHNKIASNKTHYWKHNRSPSIALIQNPSFKIRNFSIKMLDSSTRFIHCPSLFIQNSTANI